ncbi:glycoside hydrolase family 5 protein [Methylobacterium nonmethylotrophicum]|uniref:Glycoside hydrolase family 5 protein n=1 Tax=Methylobacterium nonmethylotrophicum TaxID=1141884 RepID=A0A4Z0NUS8_9HYPH|nr:glycoside hydrolase family 5 protein [Methylobacterium nonmethylotrophicum]TGE00811.1 glycoside hydrolase family 5 protein [Methylobacterium nonmethylotrophicum]
MRRLLAALASLALAVSPAAAAPRPAAPPCLRGVNLSGAEFGTVPGRYGFDYLYPSAQTIGRFAALGLTAMRLPIRWERLQPSLRGPLDPDELARLEAAVSAATRSGMRTVIDLHNYAYYGQARIDSATVTPAAFADVWRRLARHFRGDASVVFGLMNEPHDIPAKAWLEASNAAIAAIRAAGARQLVLVPGSGWTGAHSWTADLPTGNNAAIMLGTVDPGKNVAFEVHQYLDSDYSGTKGECSRGADALAAMERLTGWLARNGQRAFLGEVGASAQAGCPERLRAVLMHANANPRQWVGWTAWAAGELWPPTYHLKLDPAGANAAVVAAVQAAARAAPACER